MHSALITVCEQMQNKQPCQSITEISTACSVKQSEVAFSFLYAQCSTHTFAEHCRHYLALILQDQGVQLASNQVQYSLLYRAPEQNGVLKACQELGVTLIAYSPLCQGLLTGACLCPSSSLQSSPPPPDPAHVHQAAHLQ